MQPESFYKAKPFLLLGAGLSAHLLFDHWASGISAAALIYAGAQIMSWRGWLG